MFEVKIEVTDKDILNKISNEYKYNDRLFFDGCEGISYSKKQTELKDGKIESGFVIPDAFNMTKRNKAIFALKNKNIGVTIIMPNESIRKTIYVKKEDYSQSKFFVVYSYELGEASNILLKDIDMGTFTFNEANLLSNFPKSEYQDDDDGYWFGLCDYGGWAEIEADPLVGISTYSEDFRPLFSPLHIHRKVFESIGYSFDSKLYESVLGRHQWRYLSHDEFALSSVLSNSILVTETHSIMQTRNATGVEVLIDFDTVTLDAEGFGSDSGGYGRFINEKSYSVDVEVFFSDNILVTQADFEIAIALRRIDTPDHEYTPIVLTDTIGMQLIEGTKTITVPSQHLIYIAVSKGIGTLSDSVQGSFQVLEKASYMPSTTIQVNCAIDPNLNYGDFLKGEMQLFNAILEVNETSRTVKMLPSENANMWGEIIKGQITPKPFVNDEIENPVCNSETKEYLKNNFYLYELLFKESKDEYVDLLKERGEIIGDRLWGLKLEIDNDKKGGKKEVENKLYEPTINGYPSKQIGQSVFLPHIAKLIDNLEGNPSKSIGYRCLLGNYGTGTINGKDFNFKFEGIGRTNVPLAFQFLPKDMDLDAVWFNRQNLIFKQNITLFQTDDTLQTIFYPQVGNSDNIKITKKYLLDLNQATKITLGEWRIVTVDNVVHVGVVTSIEYKGEGKQEVSVGFSVLGD